MPTTSFDAGYVRVSSAHQRDDSDSPASQRQRLEAAGCTRIYEDLAVSGFKLSQRRRAAGFKQLLADITAGRVARLRAVRLDRLARRDQIVIELAELCEQHGVEFSTLAGGPISVSTATGWLQVKIQSVFGEHYSRALSEAVRSGYHGLHQAGIPARSAASLPFYLQRTPGTRHGVEPSPHWGAVRHAVEQVMHRAWPLSRVGLFLRERCGIRGEPTAIRRWMSAPELAGHMARHPKGRPAEIILRDVWPAMVTDAERHQLLAALAVGAGRRFERARPPKLLTGICRCSLCEGRMNYEALQRGGRRYHYLRCRRAGCDRRGVHAAPVWEQLLNHLDDHLEHLVARRAAEDGQRQEPPEVAAWRRELDVRQALPQEMRQPADQQRIHELEQLLAAAAAMPEPVEDWWPDGLAAGSLQFWSQRPETEINADLSRIIRAAVVSPQTGQLARVDWATG